MMVGGTTIVLELVEDAFGEVAHQWRKNLKVGGSRRWGSDLASAQAPGVAMPLRNWLPSSARSALTIGPVWQLSSWQVALCLSWTGPSVSSIGMAFSMAPGGQAAARVPACVGLAC